MTGYFSSHCPGFPATVYMLSWEIKYFLPVWFLSEYYITSEKETKTITKQKRFNTIGLFQRKGKMESYRLCLQYSPQERLITSLQAKAIIIWPHLGGILCPDPSRPSSHR